MHKTRWHWRVGRVYSGMRLEEARREQVDWAAIHTPFVWLGGRSLLILPANLFLFPGAKKWDIIQWRKQIQTSIGVSVISGCVDEEEIALRDSREKRRPGWSLGWSLGQIVGRRKEKCGARKENSGGAGRKRGHIPLHGSYLAALRLRIWSAGSLAQRDCDRGAGYLDQTGSTERPTLPSPGYQGSSGCPPCVFSFVCKH